MHNFYIWFTTGIEHIADWKGYDQILFLLVLCGIYPLAQWKKVLFNITAFTIGHSLTLALSVLNIIKINTSLVEFLIPVTIIITCIVNIKKRNNYDHENKRPTYWLACFFGLIHGLGFSTLLKEMLGDQQSVLFPLFSFNIGLEVGQLFIVICVMIFSLALTSILKLKQNNWNFFISSAVFGIAFIMAIDRFAAFINFK
ncbi:MAG: HupE/UreJ family protein [Bacteroidia bacterium]